jgi:hypothetical protein
VTTITTDSGTTIQGNRRPCWTVDNDGKLCELYVEISEGPQLCGHGHTTFGLVVKEQARYQGHPLSPATIARWMSYDAANQRAISTAVLRCHDGTERLLRRQAKVRPVLKYGAQPLTERSIVLTTHAREEMRDEEIETEDLWRVIVHGTVIQRQPYGVVRVSGTDTKGRLVVVCYRLNVRHEIVIVTTFLDTRSSLAA